MYFFFFGLLQSVHIYVATAFWSSCPCFLFFQPRCHADLYHRCSVSFAKYTRTHTYTHTHTHVLTSKAGAQSRTWSCFALLFFFFSSSLSNFSLCVHIFVQCPSSFTAFFSSSSSSSSFVLLFTGRLNSFFFFCCCCCCFAPIKPVFMCNTGSRTTHFHFG